MSMGAGENRRDAFRVDDLVGLEVRALDADELEKVHAGFEVHRLRHGLRTHIGHHRDSQRALLKKIKIKQPDVASYLFHIEEQLSRLADQISLGRADSDKEADETNTVSLSASGMRFSTGQTFSEGGSAELVIRLMPGSHIVYVIAEVVRVESSVDGSSRVSVRFERLHPEDEELLTRHIVKVQQRDLQTRRRAS